MIFDKSVFFLLVQVLFLILGFSLLQLEIKNQFVMIMIAITIVIYKTKAIDMIRITIRNHTNVSIKNSGGMRKQHGNRILNTDNCEKDKGGWIIQKNSQIKL